MTFQELKNFCDILTSEDLKKSVLIYDASIDEYIPLDYICSVSTDIIEEGICLNINTEEEAWRFRTNTPYY